jgi:ElaB/YqjD/DUF883 family membrane-anchored ribosome-binding protein
MPKSRIKRTVKNDINKLKHLLAETVHDMRGEASHALHERYEQARERGADLQDHVVHYVNDKPFKALGFAMLSGLVLGLAMRKKRRFYHR